MSGEEETTQFDTSFMGDDDTLPGETTGTASEGRTVPLTPFEEIEREDGWVGPESASGGSQAEYDIPPNRVGDGYFGRLLYTQNGTNLSYQFLPIDALYFAQVLGRENRREPHRTAWCMIQRFATMRRNNSAFTNFKRFIESFSQPVNPGWAWIPAGRIDDALSRGSGDNRIPGESTSTARGNAQRSVDRGEAAASEERQAGRRSFIEQLRRIMYAGDDRAWKSISLRARVAAYDILRGRCGNPIPGYDDFASYDDVVAAGLHLWALPTELQEEGERVAQSGTTNLVLSSGLSGAFSTGGRNVIGARFIRGRPETRRRYVQFIQGGEHYEFHAFARGPDRERASDSILTERDESIRIVGPDGRDSSSAAVRDFQNVLSGGGGGGGGGRGSRSGTVSMMPGTTRIQLNARTNTYQIDIYSILPAQELWAALQRWGTAQARELHNEGFGGLRIG